MVVLGLAEHSNNPAHPQFDIIRGIWHTRFLARNTAKPIALYEGICEPVRSRSPLINEELTAIKMGGGFQLLATLADKSAVTCLPDQEQVRQQMLQVTSLAEGITPEVVNYYLDTHANPHASETLFNHQDFPTIEHLAKDTRSWVLGQNVTRFWNEGYSLFVLGSNETLVNWPAQEALCAIPEFAQVPPITLLPPEMPYAALPRLAPATV